ncbi:MAG: hypothetical protein Q7R41_16265, partial [Phycisphaerales bacterium]|nr:hypothetical protein [Phycisphaerales bacterium]
TSGDSCSSSGDCGADEGDCVIGTCYDVIPDSACTTSSDCTSGFSCVSGTCADELGDLDVAYAECSSAGYAASSGDLTLYQSVRTKVGACVRESCLLTQAGDEYAVTDVKSKECRGYPETDSPFGNDIVENWRNPNTGGRESLLFTEDLTTDGDDNGTPDSLEIAPDLEPYTLLTNFEQVKTCAAGEDCVCSYKKLTFGTGEMRYFADDASFDDTNVGVCIGGTYDGAFCSASRMDFASDGFDTMAEADCEGAAGTCTYATRTDSVVGLEGYCLERDSGINTRGNRDEDYRACLTWLPVDQLVGSTDIYAKFLAAGYFEDSYVCTDVRPYVDVYPTGKIIGGYAVGDSVGNGDIACAETAEDFDAGGGDDGADGWDELGVNEDNAANSYVFYIPGEDDGCAERAACPDGFWAIMGQPSADKGTSATTEDTLAEACDGGDNTEVEDCPYTCIPYGAYVNDDGTERSCDPDSDYVSEALEEAWTYGGSSDSSGWAHDSPYVDTGRNDTDVYVIAH